MPSVRRRLLILLLAVLMIVPMGGHAGAAPPDDGLCIHVDVSVTASGELLTMGPQIANDGGFGHAGTGQTFTFTARTFARSFNICVIKLADARTWQVGVWPCANHPKPKAARTQSLPWSVTVQLDCEVSSSPGLLSASLTNGRGSAGGYVNIYAGAPGFALPDKQARGLFGPFAMQSDPVKLAHGCPNRRRDGRVRGGPRSRANRWPDGSAASGGRGRSWPAGSCLSASCQVPRRGCPVAASSGLSWLRG